MDANKNLDKTRVRGKGACCRANPLALSHGYDWLRLPPGLIGYFLSPIQSAEVDSRNRI